MSDECERLFSSYKILLEDRRSQLRMDIIKANECLRHLYGPPKKGVFDNQEVGEVEGEPAAPIILPAQVSAALQAAEALPQPPTTSEDTWGSGFDEEFDAIEGFEVESEREATPDGEVVAIEEDEVTKEDEESYEPI